MACPSVLNLAALELGRGGVLGGVPVQCAGAQSEILEDQEARKDIGKL